MSDRTMLAVGANKLSVPRVVKRTMQVAIATALTAGLRHLADPDRAQRCDTDDRADVDRDDRLHHLGAQPREAVGRLDPRRADCALIQSVTSPLNG
jgi:hypothetical protein